MASSSSVQQFQQSFQCKQCGVQFNSAESLDVHLQYHHKDNWTAQAGKSAEETNNNMTKAGIKREFTSINSTLAAADSSDLQKKSPDYNRHTPDGIFGHPPTPQSYQSASSPYQNPESTAFSPGFQNFSVKNERHSPGQSQFQPQNSFSNFSENQYYTVERQYNQEANSNKATIHSVSSFRYHPYGNQSSQGSFDRIKSQAPVASSSPAYPPQPTPSPSPKQCDKCGYVCESAAQLIEHNTLSHPSTPQVGQHAHNQHFFFDQQPPQVKTEENASQSDILDLDSQKVVHNEWEGKEGEKRSNGDQIPHSVSGMLNSWPSQQPPSNMFQNEHNNIYLNESEQPKLFQNIPENKLFPTSEQKIFQPHQNFMNNGVTSTNQELGNSPSPNHMNYRPFENLPSQPPVISSSTPISVPNNSRPSSGPPVAKSGSWKSNEARRPKTYQCTACNKWFTSSGHLKRHYNTTLHKNAVKSSGQPDPASLPISAHHHPARDSASSKDDNISSNSPIRDEQRSDDSMGPFERLNPMPGMLQHPPNGPYDRQGPPMPPMHSPMAPSPLGNHSPAMMNPNFQQIPNDSPPNGEAGLSPNNNLDSRGLLAIGSPNNMTHSMPHGFSPMMAPHQTTMMHPMDVTTNQYQMYPNEYAPHVMQATDINNLSTIGELQFHTVIVDQMNQPLPSFEQIQLHRFGIGHGLANVGGPEPATASYYYANTESFEGEKEDDSMMYQEGDEYKLAIVTTDEQINDENNVYSPTSINNNNDESSIMSVKSEIDIKFDPNEYKVDLDTIRAISKNDYEENIPVINSTAKIIDDSKTKCFDCDKVFNRPCYLTQHNKTCHTGDKPFKCTRCGKRFSSEEVHKEHSKKHAGEKPHKCEICPKQFNHKTDLRRHMCCHTGRKPYACETCGKGFIRKDHMVKHTETHLRKNKTSAIKA